VHTDWLVSFQLWQNFILNPDAKRNAYIGAGANQFDPNTLLPTNGMRDPIITNLTGYLSHDGFFMGDTGHWELSYVQNLDNGYEWLWTRFRYELNDVINLSIGASLYWGNEDDNLGQFRNNKCIFTEIKFGWK
jgi:hypothetical protein